MSITGGNRNDVTQLLPLVDAIPPIRGLRGRPRRRPGQLLADRGYDYDSYRRQLRARGITPRIARRGVAHGSGLGKQRWVVERGFAWLKAAAEHPKSARRAPVAQGDVCGRVQHQLWQRRGGALTMQRIDGYGLLGIGGTAPAAAPAPRREPSAPAAARSATRPVAGARRRRNPDPQQRSGADREAARRRAEAMKRTFERRDGGVAAVLRSPTERRDAVSELIRSDGQAGLVRRLLNHDPILYAELRRDPARAREMRDLLDRMLVALHEGRRC